MKRSKTTKKRKKVKIIKAPKIQTIFCIISIVFILGCCFFYGTRLVKYYKVFNPKSETGEVLANLSSKIISSSSIVYEGDGLYINNGSYIYKGDYVNNYILVSNMLFRIVKINNDKTIDIVLDEYINKLEYDKELTNYLDSSINEYLEEKFLTSLDKTLLTTTNICTYTISLLSEIKCDKVDSSKYVRLLGISDFLNSMNDEKTYLVSDNDNLWLYNHSEKGIWHTKGVSISNSNVDSIYGIKPVITLKNSTVYISGDGTLNNPYQISENEKNIGVGTYLDINDDIYIVYEVGEDYLKVESNRVLKDKLIFDKTSNSYENSSLKEYLEDTYLESLNYKSILKEVNFNDVKSTIGILSLNDLKFNSALENYFLSDTKDKNIYLYNSSILATKVNNKRNVRPCLGLKKDLKIISGNGSKLAPFIVEV